MNFFSICDLLPYRQDHLISNLASRIRICQLFIFLCQQAQIAWRQYICGEYEQFDAQVSENLCQIRAYQLNELANNKTKIVQNLSLTSINLRTIQLKAIKLVNRFMRFEEQKPSRYTKEIDEPLSLKRFLHKYNLNITISKEACFLIQASLLTKYKISDENGIACGISYKTLSKDLKIESLTFIRRFVHHLQRKLSEISSNFIFELLSDLNADPKKIFLTTNLYARDQDGRYQISSYEATRIILEHAAITQKAICVNITRIYSDHKQTFSFLIKFTKMAKSNQINEDILPLNRHEPLLTVKGIVKYENDYEESKEAYIERFKRMGLQEILLANIAQHPQFSGTSLSYKKYNPYERIDTNSLPKSYTETIKTSEKNFLKHKYIAYQAGCCPEKPTLFLLTHVVFTSSELLVVQPDSSELYLI